MNKTVKKREKALISALTLVCETAKDWGIGFEWLTHTVQDDTFPDSLLIICVFNLDTEVKNAVDDDYDTRLRATITQQLLKIGVRIKNSRRQVRLDSEESCLREDRGDWQKRIIRLSL